ncbi:MAG: acyltransferase family protein [Eubacterium sp.]|nr:acyltransferase family protein [Eubacterium sp.]
MKPRIAKWDNLKLFLIFCVVAGHFLARIDDNRIAQRLFFFIYLFHMPAFMFISGLMSTRSINERRYAKILNFFTAFLLTKCVLFLVKGIFAHDYTALRLWEMNDISWYMFALLVYYFVTIILGKIPAMLMIGISIALACIAGYNTHIGTFLSLSRLLCFYPFFLAGYHLDSDFIRYHTIGRPIKILSVLYVAAAAGFTIFRLDHVWWLTRILRAKYPYGSLAQYQSAGGLLRLGWYAGSALFIVSMICFFSEVETPLTRLGSRTMTVYVLHYIPLYLFYYLLGAKDWLPGVSGCAWIALLAALVTTLILCWKPVTTLVNLWITLPEKITAKK